MRWNTAVAPPSISERNLGQRTLLALFLAPLLAGQVKFEPLRDRVRVEPYLYPLRSASGKIVTRHYPIEIVPGEDTEHPHHRGVWFTHGDVNGYNFWASDAAQKSPKQGRVVLDRIISAEEGAKSGVIITNFRWLAPNGTAVLSEHRKTVFYSHPSLRIVDFDIELSPTSGPVHFGDTKEGTFAVRLGTELSEDHGGTIVSSNDRKSEKDVWGSRADWIDDFGTIGREKLGVAIFDHPANPQHPSYWHARAYGLLAANVFGLHDFLNDKTTDGGLTLEHGATLRFRYRVIIHPGDTAAAGIANLYRKFAQTE